MLTRIILLSFLVLAGCATPYQKLGRRGGYTDEKINDHVYRVSFQGNSKTRDDVVYNYFLRRSAEIALEHKFAYVLVIEADDIEKASVATLEGNNALSSDPTVVRTVGVTNVPTVNKTLVKHAVTGKVAMFKDGEEPINAIKVENILKDVKVLK
jgi:hypothetical protein